jgi:hypothetical protein
MTTQRTMFQFPLHPGSQGGDVAQAQTILTEWAFFIAPVELLEQRFGPTTAEVGYRWKERHRLPTDGTLELEAIGRLLADGRELPRIVHGW